MGQMNQMLEEHVNPVLVSLNSLKKIYLPERIRMWEADFQNKFRNFQNFS